MLTGGEDHALLATFAEGVALPDAFTMIGIVEDVGNHGAGVLVDGTWTEGKGGHEHFG